MSFDPVKKNNVTVINDDRGLDTIVFAYRFGSDQRSRDQAASAFKKGCRLVLYDTDSKLKIANAGTHFPYISAPDEIIQAIKEYI